MCTSAAVPCDSPVDSGLGLNLNSTRACLQPHPTTHHGTARQQRQPPGTHPRASTATPCACLSAPCGLVVTGLECSPLYHRGAPCILNHGAFLALYSDYRLTRQATRLQHHSKHTPNAPLPLVTGRGRWCGTMAAIVQPTPRLKHTPVRHPSPSLATLSTLGSCGRTPRARQARL